MLAFRASAVILKEALLLIFWKRTATPYPKTSEEDNDLHKKKKQFLEYFNAQVC